jgi:hypothetical protein
VREGQVNGVEWDYQEQEPVCGGIVGKLSDTTRVTRKCKS